MVKTIMCSHCFKMFPDKSMGYAVTECPNCGTEVKEKEADRDWSAEISEAEKTGDWSKLPADVIARKAANIVITSSYYISNRQIDYEIELITAECVYGMNIFRDLFAGLRDIFGGRSEATQKVLRDARRTCINELRREALVVGADAVIAVDLDYQEISGGGKLGMLMLVASGTAVKLAAK